MQSSENFKLWLSACKKPVITKSRINCKCYNIDRFFFHIVLIRTRRYVIVRFSRIFYFSSILYRNMLMSFSALTINNRHRLETNAKKSSRFLFFFKLSRIGKFIKKNFILLLFFVHKQRLNSLTFCIVVHTRHHITKYEHDLIISK